MHATGSLLHSAYLVSCLDSAAEDAAEGIEGAAVLLGIQLGDVHQQRSPGVADLDVADNVLTLWA